MKHQQIDRVHVGIEPKTFGGSADLDKARSIGLETHYSGTEPLNNLLSGVEAVNHLLQSTTEKIIGVP